MSDHRRLARGVPVALILALVTACGGDPDTASPKGACAPFAQYQGQEGTTVTIFSPVRDVESDNLARAWEQFESCTGIDIAYEGSDTFEVELPRRVAAGSPPDLAFLPQPGLIE